MAADLPSDELQDRDLRRTRQFQMIADTSADMREDEDPAVVQERLARVRAQRAEHRRTARDL